MMNANEHTLKHDPGPKGAPFSMLQKHGAPLGNNGI
jgi:hypothetical protein